MKKLKEIASILLSTGVITSTNLAFIATPQGSAIAGKGANQFAVVCLINRTNIPITYRFKWRRGKYNKWAKQVIKPGARRWHSWTYKSRYRSSPKFDIKFDYDIRPGRNKTKSYSLVRYQAPAESCKYGKKYVFRKRDRSFIDLFSTRN
ncbi:MAG: hypothetical protein QNJ47_07440 [Nostocaceae cyanobacterium]|nr:hypothetical protein [Nostocaceae cyanobacterium]